VSACVPRDDWPLSHVEPVAVAPAGYASSIQTLSVRAPAGASGARDALHGVTVIEPLPVVAKRAVIVTGIAVATCWLVVVAVNVACC
jgi:hypothetical protein